MKVPVSGVRGDTVWYGMASKGRIAVCVREEGLRNECVNQRIRIWRTRMRAESWVGFNVHTAVVASRESASQESRREGGEEKKGERSRRGVGQHPAKKKATSR